MNQDNANRSPAAYVLQGVSKLREKGGATFELRVPFFSVSKGEFVALVGQSGCGKSTLLDLLGLVLQPTRVDSFAVLDQDELLQVGGLKEKQLAQIRKTCIGYVLQTGGLLPFLSVRENIMLTRRLNRLKTDRGVIDRLAARLGIAEQLAKKPGHLSGGQRQRAAIARALAHRPAIVLADEPTAAVDKHTAREIRDEFRNLTQRLGVTVLMVTHDRDLVRSVADRTFTFQLERINANHVVSTLVEADPATLAEQ